MKYFNAPEILFSCTSFALFGSVSGLLYFIFFADLKRTAKIIKCIIYVLKSKSFSPAITLKGSKIYRFVTKMLMSIYEFCFFTLLGMAFILLLYLCCDGVIRAYTFIITAFFSYFSYKMAQICLGKGISIFLDWIYRTEYIIIYALLHPLRLLARSITNIVSPIIMRKRRKSKEKAFQTQVKQKCKEQVLILENILINPKKSEG